MYVIKIFFHNESNEICCELSLVQLVRFLGVELTQPSLSPRLRTGARIFLDLV
jgi:hypothetical protein